jgi:hypothetical protein
MFENPGSCSGGKPGGENFRKKGQKHTVMANRQRKELRELELPKPAEGAEFPESHGGTTERLVLRSFEDSRRRVCRR